MIDDVEAVARAFYEASDFDLPWEQALPQTQAEMREDALIAIASLNDYYGANLMDDFVQALGAPPSGKVMSTRH